MRGRILIALTAALALPATAAAAPGDILVVNRNLSGAVGGVFRVDPATGTRTIASANDAPFGEPSFSRPIGIATTAGGDVLVADWSAFGGPGGVFGVDPVTGARRIVSANAVPGGDPSFQDPVALAVAADGGILVADPSAFGGTGGVIRVEPENGARSAVSANGSPAGGPSFEDPVALAVAAEGDIVVADSFAFGGGGGVIRVDAQSGARSIVSANGAPAGGPSFVDPSAVAVAADGAILVADMHAFGGSGGVIRVDPETGSRTTVSSNATHPGGPSFAAPAGLALAADGDILVADAAAFDGKGGVIRVDPQSGARSAVSANGAPAGGPGFYVPWGLAVEPPAKAPPPAVPAPPAEPAPPAPDPPPPAADTVAPQLSGVSLSSARFRIPAGTRFRFALSEPATVRIAIKRIRPGPRVRGMLSRPGARGRNQLAFSGRIGRRTLPGGLYRARLTATDAAGNRSAARSVRFRIVAPR